MPSAAQTKMTYREALLQSLREGMRSNPNAIIMGQGVDDHRGTFGTTLGLVQEFGAQRVFDTPLSEDGTAGFGIGAALNGLYPIQSHIRVDFALLAMNQLINMAAKYKYISGGHFEVPMLVRMIIGRSWGQGAQHSQSLQSLFAHIPGLIVLMPSDPQSVLEAYHYAITECRSPVISIEHRLLYDIQFRTGDVPARKGAAAFASRKTRDGKDITIVATSIMVLEAMRAAAHVAQHAGIECEVIDLHCVSHIDKEMILSSLRKTGRLLVADTSWKAYGVCAEVCRLVAETDPSLLKAPVKSLGMQPAPCPTAKSLEDLYYPDQHDFVDAIAQLARARKDHGVPLPESQSMTDVYRRFKGPF